MSDNWGFGGSSFFDVIQGDSSGFGFETKKDSVENAEKREALKAEQKRAYGGHWEQFFWESVTEKQEREAKKAKLQEMERNLKERYNKLKQDSWLDELMIRDPESTNLVRQFKALK